MSTDIVVAATSFSRGTRSVVEGQTFWAHDPFVQNCDPSLFRAFTVDNEIEQATAAPGEKRSTRVRKTKAEASGAAED